MKIRNLLYSNPTLGFAKKCIKEDGGLIVYSGAITHGEVILDANLFNALLNKVNTELKELGFSPYEDDDLLEYLF